MKHVCALMLFVFIISDSDGHECDGGESSDCHSAELPSVSKDMHIVEALEEHSFEAFCDSAEMGCNTDAEDDVAFTDMSLLQMEVRLSNELTNESGRILSVLNAASQVRGGGERTVTTGSLGAIGASALHSQSSGLKSAMVQQRNIKAKTSTIALALARLKIQLQDANLAILFVLLLTLGLCFICMLATGAIGSLKEDPGHPLRPASYNGITLTRSPLTSAVPGGSRLPTQQTLSQQRTPIASSVALPPGASMVQSDPQEASKKPENISDLPPICPSLILPHTEARFMIQMAHLQRESAGPVNILGTSGRQLLHALVCGSPDNRRCLMVASCGCEDDPRTCIFTPLNDEPSQALEIFGKAGKFYGWLEFPSRNQAVLLYSGDTGMQKPVLQIEMGSREDLRMSASMMDGRLLASAGRNVGVAGRQGEGAEDSWKMQVKPGVDAVLITSCMLALILLRPWPSDDRISLGASTVGGTATSLRPSPSPPSGSSWFSR